MRKMKFFHIIFINPHTFCFLHISLKNPFFLKSYLIFISSNGLEIVIDCLMFLQIFTINSLIFWKSSNKEEPRDIPDILDNIREEILEGEESGRTHDGWNEISWEVIKS